jgi:hypothetical protein
MVGSSKQSNKKSNHKIFSAVFSNGLILKHDYTIKICLFMFLLNRFLRLSQEEVVAGKLILCQGQLLKRAGGYQQFW